MKKKSVKRKKGSALGAALRTVTTMPLALAGGWIAYSNLGIDHAVPLQKAIDADQETFAGRTGGGLAYYADTRAGGRPLVLIHSVNAAASSFEMRPLFDHFRSTRPVYALDLPGFGFSERSDREYSPRVFQDAINDFLETRVKQAADVVALSLGCEFAARAALARPEQFQSLALISPSGFGESADGVASGDTIYQALSFPLWGRPLYDLIATRPSIQYFLSQSFEGPVDPAMIDYAYATSHQPGAQYAPLYFVSGRLFTPGVRTRVYDALSLPVMVLFDRDAFVSFALLPEFIAAHRNWESKRIYPTRGLPHFERLGEVAENLGRFWKGEG
ncbi:MAG: alpha/beta fold hydrolase [Rudaea sp.]